MKPDWIMFGLGALCATTICTIAMRVMLDSCARIVRRQDRIIDELSRDLGALKWQRDQQDRVFGGTQGEIERN